MQTLRIFCDVARHHSFSTAATLHSITQSAASQRIRQLEKKLGVPLIDRSVRPLGLTPAGEAFLQGCLELLERYDRLIHEVSQLGLPTEGHVLVYAIYSAGIDLLNDAKEQFEALHNRVKVTFEYKHPDEVYQAVRSGRCDLGILSYPAQWRDVKVIPLRDEPMAAVCNPAHPLAALDKIHASQLSHYTMVTFEHSLPVARHIKRYLRDNAANPRLTTAFDNIDTIKSALAVTDDVAILPKPTVLREQLAGTLAVVDLEPPLARPIGIIYRRKPAAGFRPPVQAFVDFMLEHAKATHATTNQASHAPELIGGNL